MSQRSWSSRDPGKLLTHKRAARGGAGVLGADRQALWQAGERAEE